MEHGPDFNRLARNRDGFEDGADDGAFGAAPLPTVTDQRVKVQKSVGKHHFSGVLEVIGKHEGPTSNQRQRLGRSLPGKTPSGRDTKRERPVGSRRFYDLEQIVEEHSRDMNLGHQVLHLDDLTGIDHRLELLQLWLRAARSQKLTFLVMTRIAHRQPHQEAIELRLG